MSAENEPIKEVEDGELPEEGEIMDDEEEANQPAKQPAKQQPELAAAAVVKTESQQQPNSGNQHSPPPQNQQQGFGRRDFPQHGGNARGGTWRKSFGGGHQPFGPGRGGGKFSSAPRGGPPAADGGGGGIGRHRDYDGRMKSNVQQDEEMLDSWVRGVNRKGRPSSPRGGDISPIRTSPMIAQDEPTAVGVGAAAQPREVPMAQAEMTAAAATPLSPAKAASLEDDRDFRMARENALLDAQLNESVDDNDFRRVAQPIVPAQSPPTHVRQEPMGPRHFSPPFGEQPTPHHPHFGGERRRPRSQSPPFGGPNENDDFYGSGPKRHRPFYDEPMGGGGSPPPGFAGGPNEGPHQTPGFHGGGPPWRGGFYPRGGRTMGYGYRGGRPFFPRLICKFFREGFCRDGDKCTFSHATIDSHRRPELCRYYHQGHCKKTLFCQQMHGEWPCKAFHKGECTKEQCMFSHEPLDDVSRPIFEKMLEEERLGIVAPDHHPPFHPQQPGNQAFFRRRFPGPHQQGQGPQQFQGGPPQQQQQFHRPPFHQHPPPPPPPQFQQQQQGEMFMGGPGPHQQQHEQMQQQHQMGMGNVQQQQQAHPEFDGQPGGGPPMNTLPPPGLVVPPHLGATTAGPPSTQAGPNAPFGGFFNAAAGQPQQTPPHQMGMQQMVAQQPQQTFQQLQQQVQQGPHFPHQPSLLGPSTTGQGPPMAMGAGPMLQQNTPIKSEAFDSTMPSSTDHSAVKEEQSGSGGGGFNINQMLEQITRQQSPTPASPNINTSSSAFGNQTLDLFASVGLGLGTSEGTGFGGIAEESPASPTISADQQQADAEKPAALIPMVREWKLIPVDIPVNMGPDMKFDMKFIQQISSTNSDPRLRKLAEKQFDLVSQALEQQQAGQQNTTGNDGKSGEEDGSKKLVTDPRKASRRKMKEEKSSPPPEVSSGGSSINPTLPSSTQQSSTSLNMALPSTSSSTQSTLKAEQLLADYGYQQQNNGQPVADEAELVQRQMAALLAAQQQQMQPPNFLEQNNPLAHMHIPPPALPHGMGQQPQQMPNFQVPPPTNPYGPSPIQMSVTQQQPPMTMPGPSMFSTPPPPFAAIPQQQQGPMPGQHVQQGPPPSQFQPHFHQPPMARPPVQPQQQLGAHAFSMAGIGGQQANRSPPTTSASSSVPLQQQQQFGGGGFSRDRDRGGNGGGGGGGRRGRYQPQQHHQNQPASPKQQHQQMQQQNSPPTATAQTVVSLREKRKNNEYESPLARMASNSGGGGGGGGNRY